MQHGKDFVYMRKIVDGEPTGEYVKIEATPKAISEAHARGLNQVPPPTTEVEAEPVQEGN